MGKIINFMSHINNTVPVWDCWFLWHALELHSLITLKGSKVDLPKIFFVTHNEHVKWLAISAVQKIYGVKQCIAFN